MTERQIKAIQATLSLKLGMSVTVREVAGVLFVDPPRAWSAMATLTPEEAEEIGVVLLGPKRERR